MNDPVFNSNFVKHTIEIWQPLSNTPLTVEDARTIIRNTTAFFSLLDEWEKSKADRLESVKVRKKAFRLNKKS